MEFRTLSREDAWGPFTELWNLEYPRCKRTPEELWGHLMSLPPKGFEVFRLGMEGEFPRVAIPLLDPDRNDKPSRLEADLWFDPVHWQEWFTPAIDEVESLWSAAGASKLSLWTSDILPDRLLAFEERGYRQVQAVPASFLEIETMDVRHLLAKVEKVKERYKIATMRELDAEGLDWLPQLWEATWQMAQDMPNPEPPTRLPLEDYRVMLSNQSVFNRDYMVAALDGEQLVGYTRFSPSQGEPGLATTGMSGVVRSHRRQGIVTALKIESVFRLKELGIKTLMTDNDETNPMYALNLALGFKPAWRWLNMSKG